MVPDNPKESDQGRSARWRDVWINRDEDRADWNGFEDCFGSLADYEDWTGHVASVIRDELCLSADDVVAELGCGTGRIAALIAPHVRQVLALDYSPVALRVAGSRRQLGNISYRLADLNELDPKDLPVTKAYSVDVLYYLESERRVLELLGGFQDRDIPFAAIGLPDALLVDKDRERAYDRDLYSHLTFDADRLLERFPSARISRRAFPEYVNGVSRFNLFLGGNTSRD